MGGSTKMLPPIPRFQPLDGIPLSLTESENATRREGKQVSDMMSDSDFSGGGWDDA
jgi:hypothetical protein